MKTDIDKERAVRTNLITHLIEFVQDNRNYLQLSKPQYAALIQYLNLSSEYYRPLQTNELSEYGEEFKSNFVTLFLRNNRVDAEKVLVTLDDKCNFDVDLRELMRFLENTKRENMRLADRLAEDIETTRMLSSYEPHLGHIELEPAVANGTTLGICVKSSDGYYWSLKRMNELAHEILSFTQIDKNQEIIDERNSILYDRKQYEEEQYRKRQEELEAKTKEYKPKSGMLFLFQVFPSGLYRFSYATKTSKERKIELIKQQFGENSNIIHCVEVKNITNFYHYFVKKQYKNRLVKDGFYKLEADDIEFFKNEQYPPQAMDWMNG